MQAGTYFPKVRRMLLFHAPSILTLFWPASTLLRGHLALATLSPLEIDPQILERWATLMRFTWANISERRILSRILVSRAIAFVNFTRWIGFGMSVSCLEIHNPIVVRSMIDVQKVLVSTHDHDSYLVAPIFRDFCHGWQQVAIHFLANHSSSTWLLHSCHHSFWTFC